jgi:diguanylate cyclase (GGDEF)-like protein/PAS domain S-box-containing protein
MNSDAWDETDSAARSEMYRLIAENASDLVLWGHEGVLRWVSPSVTAVLGWTAEDLVGKSFISIVHPDDVKNAQATRPQVYGGAQVHTRLRGLTKDGGVRWFEVRISPYLDDSGMNDGSITSARDITDQVAAEQARDAAEAALLRREDRYRLLAENASDLVYFADEDGRAQWVAPTVQVSLGWTAEQLVGTVIADLIHPDDWDVVAAINEIAASGDEVLALRHGTKHPVLARVRQCDGDYRWMSVSATRVHERGHENVSVVVGMRDVQELVATQALAERGKRDDLTGLANRTHLLERLEHVLGEGRRRTDLNALLYCDIDFFKSINDSYGHAVGDLVLREFADRIRHAVRDTDLVARIGGDEFVIVLRGLAGPDDAHLVAEKVRMAMRAPMIVDGMELSRTLSIGVAMARADVSPDQLLRNADAALYEAKVAGRDRTVVSR